MDMSKLPRLSQTPPPPPIDPSPGDDATSHAPPPTADPGRAPAPSPGYALDYDARSPAGSSLAEAWIGIAVGAILLLLSPRLLQFVFSPSSFPQKWTFNDANGNPLAYTKTVFFWGDLAIAAFALVLILEGLVIGFARKSGPVAALFGLTVLTVALNAVYLVAMVMNNYGLQLMSALAVAFGVYIAIYQWNLLMTLRGTARSGR
jgi:hypothetical protein